MSDSEENHDQLEISPEEVFKLTRADALHTGVKAGLSTLPVVGDIFELLITSPASKRRDAFLISLYESLNRLEAQVNDFNLESALENEVIQTTVIQATQAAIRTHSKEKHEALRNVVLNSAISKSPDENRLAMFIRLCDALTELQIHILKALYQKNAVQIKLEKTRMDIRVGDQVFEEWFEDIYPETKDPDTVFYLQCINDLTALGFLWSAFPIKSAIKVTSLGEEFLTFLKNPLD